MVNVVFTHNDLDALGCVLNINNFLPQNTEYFYTNYANIDQIVTNIIEFVETNDVDKMIIADVSFGDNKKAMDDLYRLKVEGKVKSLLFFDHHLYPDGFFDDYPSMLCRYDKGRCATKILNDFFVKEMGFGHTIEALSDLINIYDIWLKDSPHFDRAQDLNDYFWRKVYSPEYGSIDKLIPLFKDVNYGLPKDFNDEVKDIHSEYEKAYSSYNKRLLIQRSGETSLLFVDDWFQRIQIQEMKDGANFVIGINSKGIIRIRVNTDWKGSEEQLNQLRLLTTGTTTIGHAHAFTYKTKFGLGFDNLIKEAQKVVQCIQKITTH